MNFFLSDFESSNRVFHRASFFGCFVSLTVLIASFVSSSPAEAQDNWTRFHGANGSGLAQEAKIPTEISDQNYLWKTKLSGTGSSSPVIWGDKVFVTSCDVKTAKLTLQCMDVKSGEEAWSKSFESTAYKVHRRNSFASGTPVVDENHVYISYADPDHTMVLALGHDGEKKWERDFGRWISSHGFGVSLMTYKDKLLFFNSQQAQKLDAGVEPGTSQMIALSCKDGSDIWKTPLTATRTCYAVPCVFTDAKGEDQLISCNTGDGFFSLNPDSGKKNWATIPFRMRTVASTLVADGLIIGSCGSGGGGNYLVAVRPDKEGANDPEKVYELPRANYVPSPVAVGGKLFLFTDKGIGQCFDLQTGNPLWQERIAKGFSGSPVATVSHLYIMDESGTLYVIAADKVYQLVSKHPLGEDSRATPAITNDCLFLRTESHLICVGNQ